MNFKKTIMILVFFSFLVLTISGASAVIDWNNDVDLMLYPLNDESGVITNGGTYPAYDSLEDLSGNGNNGTAYGGVTISNNNSFDFDGTNDYITIGSSSNYANDNKFIFSEWIYF